MKESNPLRSISKLPYRIPDFAKLSPEHFSDGFAEGMAEQLRALEALAANQEEPTIENVLGAWEDSGRLLMRAQLAFYPVKEADSTPELDRLADELAPKLAAHRDAIFLNKALYARFKGLRERATRDEIKLDEQDDWALAQLERVFVRSGVELSPLEQVRLRELNTQLAELGAIADKNIRESRNAGAVILCAEEVAGLTEEQKLSRVVDEGYRIELVNTSRHPLFTQLISRDARRKIYEASINRALDGEHDNRQTVIELARARAERAKLLGFASHAEYVASDGVAETVEAVNNMLGPIAKAAAAKASEEGIKLRAKFAEIYPGEEFAPWDWEYIRSVIRSEEFHFDPSDLDEFLSVKTVITAVFDAAHDLYGLHFTARQDLRGHTEDAIAYEVNDDDGSPVGLFLLDLWARPTKSGGAWMNSLVKQSDRYRELPVVTNNLNLAPGSTTMTWDNVITMFHEFGHALHALLSRGRYPSRTGTAVPRDFVEFPSQVNEYWAWQPGRLLDAEALGKLKAAENFGIGFNTVETLMASLLDQTWHQTPLEQLPTNADEVEDFERWALEDWEVWSDDIPPRYRTQYFSHIWAGGYAAGYYGYTWSEMMDADAVDWFESNGGGTAKNGEYFRRTLLQPGGTVDPAATYRRFRGRNPKVEPLLKRLGLTL